MKFFVKIMVKLIMFYILPYLEVSFVILLYNFCSINILWIIK